MQVKDLTTDELKTLIRETVTEALIDQQREQQRGDRFWQELQQFRAIVESEKIFFGDDDFADLRDKSVGREINL